VGTLAVPLLVVLLGVIDSDPHQSFVARLWWCIPFMALIALRMLLHRWTRVTSPLGGLIARPADLCVAASYPLLIGPITLWRAVAYFLLAVMVKWSVGLSFRGPSSAIVLLEHRAAALEWLTQRRADSWTVSTSRPRPNRTVTYTSSTGSRTEIEHQRVGRQTSTRRAIWLPAFVALARAMVRTLRGNRVYLMEYEVTPGFVGVRGRNMPGTVVMLPWLEVSQALNLDQVVNQRDK